MTEDAVGSYNDLKNRVASLSNKLKVLDDMIGSLKSFQREVESLRNDLKGIVSTAAAEKDQIKKDLDAYGQFRKEAEGLGRQVATSHESAVRLQRTLQDRLDGFAGNIRDRAASELAPFRNEVERALEEVTQRAKGVSEQFREGLKAELDQCKATGKAYRDYVTEIRKAAAEVVLEELKKRDIRLGRLQDAFKAVHKVSKGLKKNTSRTQEVLDGNMSILREWSHGVLVRKRPFAALARLNPTKGGH